MVIFECGHFAGPREPQEVLDYLFCTGGAWVMHRCGIPTGTNQLLSMGHPLVTRAETKINGVDSADVDDEEINMTTLCTVAITMPQLHTQPEIFQVDPLEERTIPHLCHGLTVSHRFNEYEKIQLTLILCNGRSLCACTQHAWQTTSMPRQS